MGKLLGSWPRSLPWFHTLILRVVALIAVPESNFFDPFDALFGSTG